MREATDGADANLTCELQLHAPFFESDIFLKEMINLIMNKKA